MQAPGLAPRPYRAPSELILQVGAFALVATAATGIALGAIGDIPLLGVLAIGLASQSIACVTVWFQARRVEAARLATDQVVRVAENVPAPLFAIMLGGPLLAVAGVSAVSGGDPFAARTLAIIGVANAGSGLLTRLFSVRPIPTAQDEASARRKQRIGLVVGGAVGAVLFAISALTQG